MTELLAIIAAIPRTDTTCRLASTSLARAARRVCPRFVRWLHDQVPIPEANLVHDLIAICNVTWRLMIDELLLRITCAVGPQRALPPPPSPVPMMMVARQPLKDVLRLLESAADGDDIKLQPFADGAEQLVFTLELLGPWTHLAAREMRGSLKLRESRVVLDADDDPRLEAVLASELDAGLRDGCGSCVEGSAALALCWLVRFLGLWVDTWNVKVGAGRPTFKEGLEKAYSVNVQPYHAWLLQRAFFFSISIVPSWSESKELLAGYDAEAGEAGAFACIDALREGVDKIRATLKERGAWDESVVGQLRM